MDACAALGADLVLERSPADWPAALQAGLAEYGATRRASTPILDVIGGDEADRNLDVRAPEGDDRPGRPDGRRCRSTVNLGLLLAKRVRWIGTVLRSRPLGGEGGDQPSLRRRGAAAVQHRRAAAGDRPPVPARRRRRRPRATWRPTPTSARSCSTSADHAAATARPFHVVVPRRRSQPARPTMTTSTTTSQRVEHGEQRADAPGPAPEHPHLRRRSAGRRASRRTARRPATTPTPRRRAATHHRVAATPAAIVRDHPAIDWRSPSGYMRNVASGRS